MSEIRSGEFFSTKYILPVGYAYFPYTENHPDYIRYPFIILLYAFLFLVAPDSAATIKLFNGVLFLLNGFLIFCIALSLLVRSGSIKLFREIRNWIAAFMAILAGFAVENHCRHFLSDERKPHPVSELAEDGLLIYQGEDFS